MEEGRFRRQAQKLTEFLDKDFSNLKSTYKGFIAFFQRFAKITRGYSEALAELSKDAGDFISLKQPLTKCLQFESTHIKQLIRELLETVEGMAAVQDVSAKAIESEVINKFSQMYLYFKELKEGQIASLGKSMKYYDSALDPTARVQIQRQHLGLCHSIVLKQFDLEEYRAGITLQCVNQFVSVLKGGQQKYALILQSRFDKYNQAPIVIDFEKLFKRQAEVLKLLEHELGGQRQQTNRFVQAASVQPRQSRQAEALQQRIIKQAISTQKQNKQKIRQARHQYMTAVSQVIVAQPLAKTSKRALDLLVLCALDGYAKHISEAFVQTFVAKRAKRLNLVISPTPAFSSKRQYQEYIKQLTVAEVKEVLEQFAGQPLLLKKLLIFNGFTQLFCHQAETGLDPDWLGLFEILNQASITCWGGSEFEGYLVGYSVLSSCMLFPLLLSNSHRAQPLLAQIQHLTSGHEIKDRQANQIAKSKHYKKQIQILSQELACAFLRLYDCFPFSSVEAASVLVKLLLVSQKAQSLNEAQAYGSLLALVQKSGSLYLTSCNRNRLFQDATLPAIQIVKQVRELSRGISHNVGLLSDKVFGPISMAVESVFLLPSQKARSELIKAFSHPILQFTLNTTLTTLQRLEQFQLDQLQQSVVQICALQTQYTECLVLGDSPFKEQINVLCRKYYKRCTGKTKELLANIKCGQYLIDSCDYVTFLLKPLSGFLGKLQQIAPGRFPIELYHEFVYEQLAKFNHALSFKLKAYSVLDPPPVPKSDESVKAKVVPQQTRRQRTAQIVKLCQLVNNTYTTYRLVTQNLGQLARVQQLRKQITAGVSQALAKALMQLCLTPSVFSIAYTGSNHLNQLGPQQFLEKSQLSLTKQSGVLDQYLREIAASSIPQTRADVFGQIFKLMAVCTKNFMLNPCKFRVGSKFKVESKLAYDFRTFVEVLASNGYGPEAEDSLLKYGEEVNKVLTLMLAETSELISQFETSQAKNNRQKSETVMRVLFLRKDDKVADKFSSKFRQRYGIS